MFGKQRCYLCGGKLDNGRCTVCGLDNTKKQKKNYRLNESSLSPAGEKAVERAERDEQRPAKEEAAGKRARRAERAEEKTITQKSGRQPARDGKAPGTAAAKPMQMTRRMADRPYDGMRTKRYLGWIVAVVLIISVGVPIVTELLDSADSEADRQVWTEEDYDPYQFAARELSDSGDVYDALLGQGKYYVGVNIPEGSYTVELADGEGSLNVDDPENGIYLYQYFGYDEDYGDKTLLEDVRLYEGAAVSISGQVRLDFHSENAQVQSMSYETNPLTESVPLEAGRTYTAGTDFPEGVYDISGSDWVTVDYKVYLGEIYDEEDLNYQWENVWFGEEPEVYCNAVLPAGTEITADGDGAVLVPSPVTGGQDYEGYYDR